MNAIFVKDIIVPARPDIQQKLYRLEPPANRDVQYVVVSGADVPFSGPETYIFRSDEDGKITDWLEMRGSFRGDIDHARALSGLGYTEVSA